MPLIELAGGLVLMAASGGVLWALRLWDLAFGPAECAPAEAEAGAPYSEAA